MISKKIHLVDAQMHWRTFLMRKW